MYIDTSLVTWSSVNIDALLEKSRAMCLQLPEKAAILHICQHLNIWDKKKWNLKILIDECCEIFAMTTSCVTEIATWREHPNLWVLISNKFHSGHKCTGGFSSVGGAGMFMLQRRPATGSETDGCKGVGQLYRQRAQQPSPSLGLVLLSIKKYFDFNRKGQICII